MAIYQIPCTSCCLAGGGSYFKPQAQKQKCCIPCGKLAYPEQLAENENARFKRYLPLNTMLETNQKMTVRQEVENRAEVRKIQSLAKFKTAQNLEERQMDMVAKADKLKTMMQDEMKTYVGEMKDTFEKQQDSKLDQMRERVKTLREKRQEEERQYVEKRLEEVYQTQCEQMRTLLGKKVMQEIVQDWGEQLKMKERLECEEAENERMYACLSNLDVQNKWKREQEHEAMRAEILKQGVTELDRQIQYKKERAADLARMQAKEQEMNEKILQELEEERRKLEEEKKARYEKAIKDAKDMIDTRDHYRNRRLKREEIVAQEFLRKAVRELYIEEADRDKAKKELMRSINIYLDYLKKRDCYNNSREAELQRIIDAVIEEQYIKVTETRRREQQQKRQLFCNVMKGRATQIADAKDARVREEMEQQKEVEFLKADWKVYLKELELEKEIELRKKRQYRCDLDSQVQYQATLKCREKAEIGREQEFCEMQEGFFLNRLNNTVRMAKYEKSNPFRQCLLGKSMQQVLRPIP